MAYTEARGPEPNNELSLFTKYLSDAAGRKVELVVKRDQDMLLTKPEYADVVIVFFDGEAVGECFPGVHPISEWPTVIKEFVLSLAKGAQLEVDDRAVVEHLQDVDAST